jgi:hypothetical protein
MNNTKINSSKMINYIIKTDELLQENMQTNIDIMKIIDETFSNPINPYSKEVLQNIIAKILNKNKISEIQKNIIIKILNKLKENQSELTNIDLIMYIIDKIYLYNITDEKKYLINLISTNFDKEFKNYINLYEIKNLNSVANIGIFNKSIKIVNNTNINQSQLNPLTQSGIIELKKENNSSILQQNINTSIAKPVYLNKNGVEIKVGNKVTVNNKNQGEIISLIKNNNQNKIIIRKKKNSGNIITKTGSVKKIQMIQPVLTSTIGTNSETGFSEPENNN